MSLSGFVDEAWSAEPIDLTPLPRAVQSSLVALAAGRAEPLGGTVREICATLQDGGFEGTVEDAVTYWCRNYAAVVGP